VDASLARVNNTADWLSRSLAVQLMHVCCS
jgi:hypothetical protein